MGAIGLVRRLLELLIQFFRFIPSIAWLTPVPIWFGIGENGKHVLIVYTTTFMVTLNTFAGVHTVATNRLRAAHCLGARRWQLFLYVSWRRTVATRRRSNARSTAGRTTPPGGPPAPRIWRRATASRLA